MTTTLDGKGSIEWLEVPKGLLAFLNSHVAGLVPCRISYLRRVTFDSGRRVEYWADCVITATRGHYNRGDMEARDLSCFVPRDKVHKSRQRIGHYVIWAHDWSDYIPSMKTTISPEED